MRYTNIPHPSNFIDAKYTDIIRHYAAAAEKDGALHFEQLKVIRQQKWFNLFVPKVYGGLQLTLEQGLQIEEAVAWADGSTGWTVTLCSGAGWFIGFLHPATAAELFADSRVCLAGSGRASGIAKDLGDTFEISGHWNYATGALIATAFTANCKIEKGGHLQFDDKGNPVVLSFVFLNTEVDLHPNWKTVGMIATASNSFSVQQLKVNKNRAFLIDSGKVQLENDIYQYPFLQFAEATLAVNNSGMAMRFLDLCEILAEDKEAGKQLMLTEKTAAAKLQLQQHRKLFYLAIHNSWQIWMQNKTHDLQSLLQVSTASRALATAARSLVDEVYPYCGLIAASTDTEINRVWRNLHTSSQHSLLL